MDVTLPALIVLWSLGAGSAQADTSLQSLAWLAGCWAGREDGVEMEEQWTGPKAA